MDNIIKRGPEPHYKFAEYEVGHEIKIPFLKQSSFKSMVSKFNKTITERHVYKYEMLEDFILARRVR